MMECWAEVRLTLIRKEELKKDNRVLKKLINEELKGVSKWKNKEADKWTSKEMIDSVIKMKEDRIEELKSFIEENNKELESLK